ncbi:MAG TPA: hypothetical protein VF431_03875 [Candidatus Methylomirabilis sp.]
MRDEARRLIACGILGVLVGSMLLAVHPTQIVLIAGMALAVRVIRGM